MQKLFSTFPAGAPGVALLLLRAVCTALLLLATLYFDPIPSPLGIVLIVLSAALVTGFLTQIVACLCACLAAVAALEIGGSFGIVVGLHGLSAMALMLLGAGAYSIDARLFGRRVIILEK